MPKPTADAAAAKMNAHLLDQSERRGAPVEAIAKNLHVETKPARKGAAAPPRQKRKGRLFAARLRIMA